MIIGVAALKVKAGNPLFIFSYFESDKQYGGIYAVLMLSPGRLAGQVIRGLIRPCGGGDDTPFLLNTPGFGYATKKGGAR